MNEIMETNSQSESFLSPTASSDGTSTEKTRQEPTTANGAGHTQHKTQMLNNDPNTGWQPGASEPKHF